MDRYLKQIKWCWDNDIYIYPRPKNGTTKCRVEIDYKGSAHVSPEEYKQGDELYNKIFEYYNYYFNKRNTYGK